MLGKEHRVHRRLGASRPWALSDFLFAEYLLCARVLWEGLGEYRDVALSDRHTLGITAMVLGTHVH